MWIKDNFYKGKKLSYPGFGNRDLHTCAIHLHFFATHVLAMFAGSGLGFSLSALIIFAVLGILVTIWVLFQLPQIFGKVCALPRFGCATYSV